MKKFISYIAAAAVLSLVILLSSCGDTNETTQATPDYIYTPSSSDNTTENNTQTGNEEVEFKIDESWQKNYEVVYKYFNSEQDNETINIREKKTDSAFTVEDIDSASVLYYKAKGNDTDYYVIVPDEKEQVHSVLRGEKFSTLSSMFMKLSGVDELLPKQSNVLYMYDENVAGRSCHKYIQRAYSNGSLTQTVYVWVDSEFGFAAKCEAYDENEKLVTMWEISEFKTGSLKASDVEIDLSGYKIVEEAG